MARPSRETVVRYAQESSQEQLLALSNVVGVGTGLRVRNGEFTDEVCVQVFVERKLAPEALDAWQTVPARVPGYEGANVRTDVIEAPVPDALQADTTRYRPVPGGCSIGPEATVSAGTLGGWACDELDETTVLVSNNHVISNLDAMPALRRIVQPARLDGGVLPGDVIGRLKRHQQVNTVANPPTVPVPTSVVDAAIGSIDAGIDIDHDVLAIGPAIYELRAPALNMNVQKRGRTTQLTTNGRVTTVGATFNCTYRNRTRISQIQNAFRITSTNLQPFGSPGDSGSLIFDQAAGQLNGTRPVVGLLYAGGTIRVGPLDIPFTDANDINAVFGALDLTTVCDCVVRAIIRAIFGRRAADEGTATGLERQLRRLRARLADTEFGTTIDDLITREAATAGRILASDDEAFELAVEVLTPLAGRPSLTKLLETPLDDDTVTAVGQLSAVFARHDRRLGRETKSINTALRGLQGSTIGEVLRAAGRQRKTSR
jgi:hypothetical protein